MSHSQQRLETAEDLTRLRIMLERTVAPVLTAPDARKSAPLAQNEPVSILDVACGACEEAAVLADFFSQLKSGDRTRPLPVDFVGTDVRERELDHARDRFRPTDSQTFEFLPGDASKLSQHRSLREKFDVVFFRHQNLYHGRTLWQRIFEEGLAKMNEDGLLVITSYFDREHTLALKAFQKLGAEIVTTLRNPHSRELATPGKSVDRHVAVLRRRKG